MCIRDRADGVLRHNPRNPHWADRDRFVLSNGHASMLLYALLHLSGYALPMDELKKFRQLHSKTPGHPEVDVTPGVETTTGPLGQGLGNACLLYTSLDGLVAGHLHRDAGLHAVVLEEAVHQRARARSRLARDQRVAGHCLQRRAVQVQDGMAGRRREDMRVRLSLIHI